MLAPFTPLLRDLSTSEGFRFEFACAICGRTWTSSLRGYDEGRLVPPLAIDLRALVWETGHRAAFEQAEVEALFHFNHCDHCDRWVCDRCYRPSAWPQSGDTCAECATAGS
jgi:hypothetical protein